MKELEATITNLGSALDKLRLNHGEECRQMIETSKEHIENCTALTAKNAELSREVERLKGERGQLRTDVGECRAMLCQSQLEILEREKSLRSALAKRGAMRAALNELRPFSRKAAAIVDKALGSTEPSPSVPLSVVRQVAEALTWCLEKEPSPCRCMDFSTPPHVCTAHLALASLQPFLKSNPPR